MPPALFDITALYLLPLGRVTVKVTLPLRKNSFCLRGSSSRQHMSWISMEKYFLSSSISIQHSWILNRAGSLCLSISSEATSSSVRCSNRIISLDMVCAVLPRNFPD